MFFSSIQAMRPTSSQNFAEKPSPFPNCVILLHISTKASFFSSESTKDCQFNSVWLGLGCNVQDWQNTCSLLKQFGGRTLVLAVAAIINLIDFSHLQSSTSPFTLIDFMVIKVGVVPSLGYWKMKLLLLLSLVSEPRIRHHVSVESQSFSSPLIPLSDTSSDVASDTETGILLNTFGAQEKQQDDLISLLFISGEQCFNLGYERLKLLYLRLNITDCALLIRLVRFASQFYPLSNNVSFSSDPDLKHFANGGLLLSLGNCFSKNKQFHSLRNELLLKSEWQLLVLP
jgi:hypothetical protein